MNTRKLIKLSLLFFLLIIAWIFFIPRTYDVLEFEARTGTEYWDLSTGSKIGYTKIESTAEGKKSPIIYLHGGPGGRIKDEIIEALLPLAGLGHDLYFYDQVGSGHSSRLDDISEYSVQRHREDLQEIIETINAEKVILIGQSWGCLLAVNYLQDHSAKVERMILGGPGPILPINRSLRNVLPPDSLNLQQPAFTNQEGNKKANNFRSKLMLRWAYIFKGKLASDKEADDFFTFLNGELRKSTYCDPSQSGRSKGGGGYYSHIMTVKSFYEVEDKRDLLEKINIPVLIIRGQCDNQKWGYAKEYLDLLPNAQLEIVKNTGHNLVEGNRERYLELIRGFILPSDH